MLKSAHWISNMIGNYRFRGICYSGFPKITR
jgi:hypothetical protein